MLNLSVENHCNIKIVLVIINWLKLLSCYNSYEVLYGGRRYNLYVDAVVVLAWYICEILNYIRTTALTCLCNFARYYELLEDDTIVSKHVRTA
jgi:hypothetical protein